MANDRTTSNKMPQLLLFFSIYNTSLNILSFHKGECYFREKENRPRIEIYLFLLKSFVSNHTISTIQTITSPNTIINVAPPIPIESTTNIVNNNAIIVNNVNNIILFPPFFHNMDCYIREKERDC